MRESFTKWGIMMLDFTSDFNVCGVGGGCMGGVLSVCQNGDKTIAIMIDKGLSSYEILLKPEEAKNMIKAIKRELGENDDA